MAKTRIDVALRARATVGEGGVWCERRRVLWWVDIDECKVNAFTPADGGNRAWDVGERVGCLALTDGDMLVLAMQNGLSLFSPADGALTPLVALEAEKPNNRANDGAVSRDGRFFITTMPLGDRDPPQGALYRYDGGDRLATVCGGLHVGNGLAFSPDNKTAYLADTFPAVQTIWAFDYDSDDGALSRRRVFYHTGNDAGRPDGGCVDADGCYWTAGVGGGELLRLTPAGVLDRKIALPVTRPSKPCFGGDNLDTLFVTSIGKGAPADGDDGSILAIRCGCQGVREGRMGAVITAK